MVELLRTLTKYEALGRLWTKAHEMFRSMEAYEVFAGCAKIFHAQHLLDN